MKFLLTVLAAALGVNCAGAIEARHERVVADHGAVSKTP